MKRQDDRPPRRPCHEKWSTRSRLFVKHRTHSSLTRIAAHQRLKQHTKGSLQGPTPPSQRADDVVQTVRRHRLSPLVQMIGGGTGGRLSSGKTLGIHRKARRALTLGAARLAWLAREQSGWCPDAQARSRPSRSIARLCHAYLGRHHSRQNEQRNAAGLLRLQPPQSKATRDGEPGTSSSISIGDDERRERERPGTRRTGPWALASLLADAPGARVQLPARRLSRPWQTGHAVSRGHESRHMASRWSCRLREHLNVGANAEGAGSPGPDERRSSTSSAVCHRGIATRRRGRRKQNVNRRQRGHTHPQRRDITMPPCEASTH